MWNAIWEEGSKRVGHDDGDIVQKQRVDIHLVLDICVRFSTVGAESVSFEKKSPPRR